MTWHTKKPPPGEYIVVDMSYGHRFLGVYHATLGWCINGRWLGHDAVELWHDLPELPKRVSKVAP